MLCQISRCWPIDSIEPEDCVSCLYDAGGGGGGGGGKLLRWEKWTGWTGMPD